MHIAAVQHAHEMERLCAEMDAVKVDFVLFVEGFANTEKISLVTDWYRWTLFS